MGVGNDGVVGVVGVGNDGKNHGLRVRLPSAYVGEGKVLEGEQIACTIRDLYYGADVPHLTVSLAEGAKPEDTQHIAFTALTPFVAEGRLGYWKNGRLVVELEDSDVQTKLK